MTRVNNIGTFLEAIRDSPSRSSQPETSSAPRSVDSSTSQSPNGVTALRILEKLRGQQQGVEVSSLMKETGGTDFVDFALALQNLEKLNAIVVDRGKGTRIARLGPAWEDVLPLLTA
jgi:hypothetical protein